MPTLDSDVLRWMAQAEMGDKKEKKREKKWKMDIHSWMGARTTGEWVRESVATDVKRVFERHTHGKGDDGKPCIVKQQVEEVVYMHAGYRPKLEGEKDTRKAFYFRGAKVWRDR